MKKLRSMMVLLAAGTFAASGLFGQEIKFDGYVNTGLGMVYSNNEKPDNTSDSFLAVAGVDSEQSAFRIRLNATYANEAGNAGAFLRLQAGAGNNVLAIPVAYGWFSAFDNILRVTGGLVDDGTWNTPGYFLGSDMGEGLGALVKVTPASGLDIGLGAYLYEVPNEAANNQLVDNSNVDGITFSGRYYAHDLDKAKYTFNAAYTLPDLVKIVASFRPKSEIGGINNPYTPSRLRAGVSLLAVPNLTAALELELDNLQDFKKMKVDDKTAWNTDTTGHTINELGGTGNRGTIGASGKINITETVQYNMGDLSVGLWAVEWVSMGEKKNKDDPAKAEATDLAFYVNPWVSYTVGSLVPRLDIGYGGAARSNFAYINPDNDQVGLGWHRKNYTPVYDGDYSVISIRPSVKINLDSRTFVEIGDLIDIDSAPKGTWSLTDPESGDSRIANVFYVDFKWSF